MNVEIGAEAAQFLEKEYINGIAFAVHKVTWTCIMVPSGQIRPAWEWWDRNKGRG